MTQDDMLQKFDVPKYIKYLSVIYIAISIATGTIGNDIVDFKNIGRGACHARSAFVCNDDVA